MRADLKYLAVIFAALCTIALTACTQGGETVPSYQYSPQDIQQASLGYYTLQPQDTLLSVSQAYQVDLADVIRLNDLARPGKLGNGARIKIPAPRLYTVQPRDSLPRIAQLFDVSSAEIIQINHLSPPYHLRAGQILRLSRPQGEQQVQAVQEVQAVQTVQINHLSPPYHLRAGQILRLSRPQAEQQVQDVQAVQEVQAVQGGQVYGGQDSHTPITRESLGALAQDSGKVTANRIHQTPKLLQPPKTQVSREANFVASGAANHPSGVLKYEQTEPESAHLAPAVITDMPALNRSGFLTPVSGKIISNFGPKSDGLHNDGVNISAARGTPVRAAQNGVVVYAGDEISGFGHLILIKHGGEYITAYAHMDKMLAKKGDVITRGQTIGTVGTSGHVARPQLHFEIRKGKKAVNPTGLIKI